MNIGLIGCGRVAHVHMRVYAKIENVQIAAVSDIDLKKARNFAEKYGINKFFSDYVKLLEIKDLDFVDICTPTSTHLMVVCDAAKFGNDILLEKPMALSAAECDKMIHEIKKARIKLCVCHNQLFLPPVRKLKWGIDSGYYNPISVRTSYKVSKEYMNAPNWTITPKEKGALWEMGYHLAYLQLEFLKKITGVYALGRKVKYPVRDNLAVLLLTPDHSYGLIELSMLTKDPELVSEIDCSDGKRLKIDLLTNSFVEKNGVVNNGGLRSEIKRVLRHFVRPPKTPMEKLGYSGGHYHLIKKYIESLKNEKPSPVQPEKGKEAIQLLEWVEESLNKNEVVSCAHRK